MSMNYYTNRNFTKTNKNSYCCILICLTTTKLVFSPTFVLKEVSAPVLDLPCLDFLLINNLEILTTSEIIPTFHETVEIFVHYTDTQIGDEIGIRELKTRAHKQDDFSIISEQF